MLSQAEYHTYQFYAWEYRGKGWFLSDEPIYLEPPFLPFYRHRQPIKFLDDGKRHTIISKIIETVRGKKVSNTQDPEILKYEELEPFKYPYNEELYSLQIKLVKDRKVTVEKMKAFIEMLSHSDVNTSFEVLGNSKEIIIQFVSNRATITNISTYCKSFFPEFMTLYNDSYLEGILHIGSYSAVVDFGLQEEFMRPLYTPKNFTIDPLTAIIGILDQLQENESAGIQILFQGVCNDWKESIVRSVTLPDGTSFFNDDPKAPQVAFEKIQSPLFAVSLRAFSQARNENDAVRISENIQNAIINNSRSSTNILISLTNEEYDFQTRFDDIYLRRSHRLGMLLNADELITFLHFPSESIMSKKLFGASRKTKDVPLIAMNKAFILGKNSHNGIIGDVTFGTEDRLKHTHIIGATGTGKSTLIANLIIQDIQKNIGLVLFDPHGDLIDDVISHIPKERLEDVVLIDPSDTDYPIGLNILQAHTDIEKEVLSSDLVASFRKYATSWGDQMNSVLGNAIQALLESREGGTLNDLRRFLIEKDYRHAFLKTVSDPAIKYYWQKEYPLLKTNSIGPILTRLDTFLRPRSIRNMVIQKTGIDFESLLNSNKIILLKLSQGLIGTENSYLLGSLILSKIHQALFRRQQTAHRNPIMIYLDEFQNFITPSIKEMLSGIRKYNVGLTLSHQDLQQLQREDSELLNSVLGNINNRIVFRVGEPDAKKLQDGFSDFDFIDLQNLGRGEAIIRIEQPQYDCSLDTVIFTNASAEEKERNTETVVAHSRILYATPRIQVEELLRDSFGIDVSFTEEKNEIVKEKQIKNEVISPKTIPIINDETIPPVSDASNLPEEHVLSTHRYLQTLVKKMAEANGYTATLEMQVSHGSGQVDVVLMKDGKTVAVEISNTTDSDWEMHNISKCLAAHYDTVISLSGDLRHLERIRKKCIENIPGFDSQKVLFFTPDALFTYFNQSQNDIPQNENIIKGYRVNVSYDSITHTEMKSKRASVAQIIMNSIKKRKK